jgi:hypothetical protein
LVDEPLQGFCTLRGLVDPQVGCHVPHFGLVRLQKEPLVTQFTNSFGMRQFRLEEFDGDA